MKKALIARFSEGKAVPSSSRGGGTPAAADTSWPGENQSARQRVDEAPKKRAQEVATAQKRAEEAAAKKRAEEAAAKKRAEEAAARKAEETAAKKRAEEAAMRKRAEEAAIRQRAREEAAARKKAEEAAIRQRAREEAAARKRAEEAAARKRAEEIARKRAEEAAARKRAEEAAARKRAEEAARKRAEEAAIRKRAEEAAARKRVEEAAARKKMEEAAATKRAEEEKEKAKVEADAAALKAVQQSAMKRIAEEAAKRASMTAVHVRNRAGSGHTAKETKQPQNLPLSSTSDKASSNAGADEQASSSDSEDMCVSDLLARRQAAPKHAKKRKRKDQSQKGLPPAKKVVGTESAALQSAPQEIGKLTERQQIRMLMEMSTAQKGPNSGTDDSGDSDDSTNGVGDVQTNQSAEDHVKVSPETADKKEKGSKLNSDTRKNTDAAVSVTEPKQPQERVKQEPIQQSDHIVKEVKQQAEKSRREPNQDAIPQLPKLQAEKVTKPQPQASNKQPDQSESALKEQKHSDQTFTTDQDNSLCFEPTQANSTAAGRSGHCAIKEQDPEPSKDERAEDTSSDESEDVCFSELLARRQPAPKQGRKKKQKKEKLKTAEKATAAAIPQIAPEEGGKLTERQQLKLLLEGNQ